MDYRHLIQSCEEYLRTGQDSQVRKIILPIKFVQVDRSWRLPLANVCRRASLITLGLRLLTPIISSNRKSGGSIAQPAELAEYAILLQRAGAVHEALQILNRLDSKTQPIVMLYKSFCHFNLWQYGSTVDLLRTYSQISEDPYQKFVGQVNLAASLVALNRWCDAESLLLENIEIAEANGYDRLLGNSHELMSQVLLFNYRLDEAEASIRVAEAIFQTSNTLDNLLVGKCRAFLESLRLKSRQPLQRLGAQARAWPHPETAREADLFSLFVEYDEETYQRLLFGTSFSAYHDRAHQLLNRTPKDKVYLYGSNSNQSAILDVTSGKIGDGRSISSGSQTHQLIEILLRDFYRPSRIGGLFGELFPGEYFDIFSSPGRVRQALRRARKWIRESDVGLEILEHRGAYFIKVKQGFGVQVPLVRRSVSTYSSHLNNIREIFPPGTTFTSIAARTRLNLSASAMQRFLAWATSNGELKKFGASSNSKYFVPLSDAA